MCYIQENTELVRSQKDIDAFYEKYGLEKKP